MFPRVGSAALAVSVLLLAFAAPAAAQFTTVSPPLTGGSPVATGFPSCGMAPATGPLGVIVDSSHLFAADLCNADTYSFPATGGSAAGAQSAANGLNMDLVLQGGHYYGDSCAQTFCPGTASSTRSDGIYEFNPTTLAVTRTVAPLNGPRGLAADPASGDIYVTTCGGSSNRIYRIQNPATGPVVTPFGNFVYGSPGQSICFDGLAFNAAGSILYATDYYNQQVYAYNKATGAVRVIASLSPHGPDGLAVAPPSTTVGGINVSNNVFVNDNDGTIQRIDVNNGDSVSQVASGGSRGDFAHVGSDGCLYVSQTTEIEKLGPCFFGPSGNPHLRPTVTQVICNYIFATMSDTCTASVGDSGAPPRTTPTGVAHFTSTSGGFFDQGNSCLLQPTPLSPGVASCAVDFIPANNSFPAVIATYPGDSQHSSSSGSTRMITPIWGPTPSGTEGADLCSISVSADIGPTAQAAVCRGLSKQAARDLRDVASVQCALYAFGGAVFTVGGPATAGFAVGFGALALTACLTAVAANRIWEDPPDRHWRTIVRPKVPRVPSLHLHGGARVHAAGRALIALIRAMVTQMALTDAMATSIDRAASAYTAHNARWARKQKKAAEQYAGEAASVLATIPSLSRIAYRALIRARVHTKRITAAQFAGFQRSITTAGVPRPLSRAARALGVGAFVKTLRVLILAATAPKRTAFPAVLVNPASLAAYTREARALRAFSRGRR